MEEVKEHTHGGKYDRVSLGIPARVVGGFQRGEWNPYGRYFMVRMKDAHSWVEAFFDGAGTCATLRFVGIARQAATPQATAAEMTSLRLHDSPPFCSIKVVPPSGVPIVRNGPSSSTEGGWTL